MNKKILKFIIAMVLVTVLLLSISVQCFAQSAVVVDKTESIYLHDIFIGWYLFRGPTTYTKTLYFQNGYSFYRAEPYTIEDSGVRWTGVQYYYNTW